MPALFRTALLILTAVAVAGCTKAKTRPSGSEKIVPVAKLTADELIAEYDKNPFAADQKYKEKPVQIEGTVAEFGHMPLLGDFVGIGAGVEGEFAMMCFLYKDENEPKETKEVLEKAAKLKKGDKVKFIGMCQGKAPGLGNIYIRHCFFPDEK
jgi:hypothetical protein